MKKLLLLLLLFHCINTGQAQDVFTRGMVYQILAMKNVVMKTKLAFRNVSDTVLHFDIYYPPGFDSKKAL